MTVLPLAQAAHDRELLEAGPLREPVRYAVPSATCTKGEQPCQCNDDPGWAAGCGPVVDRPGGAGHWATCAHRTTTWTLVPLEFQMGR